MGLRDRLVRGERASVGLAGAAGAATVGFGVWCSARGPHEVADGVVAVVYLAAVAGALPLAYVAGAVGLGRLAGGLFRGSGERAALQTGVGLALMLTLSHLLGALGLFGGVAGRMAAGAPVVAGIGLLVHQLVRSEGRESWGRFHPAHLLAGPGLAMLVVAACHPPGGLWSSEGGGYDALSYHVQLPREWVGLGRLEPVEHNVYSYLPGYVEGAFYHVAVLGGARGENGLIAGEGNLVIACQFLHALMAVMGAWLVSRAARTACERSGLVDGGLAAGTVFAATLLTPWCVVTGSLAYNDMAVVGLGACGLIAAMERGMSGWMRGALAALLVGAACGAKPTAMVMVAPAVGIALAACSARREWWRIGAAGVVVGALMLLPWMARNWAACGNPVFPFAAEWFGGGHWSGEQLARYRAAHSFTGSIVDRVRLLAWVDERGEARGFAHVQWGVLGVVMASAGVASVARGRTRAMGMVLGAGLVMQVVGWMFATHLQSRFLLPMLVTGGPLIGLAIAGHGGGWKRLAGVGAGVGLAVAQCAALVFVFLGEGPRGPGGGRQAMAGLVPGVGFRTGELWKGAIGVAGSKEARELLESLPPSAFVNLVLPPEMVVYLLGDGAALYYREPLVYQTTWDGWLMGEAIRTSDDPAAWTAHLRGAGVGAVVVNMAEISRLTRSGFIDPVVTVERVEAWMGTLGEPLMAWPEMGQALFVIGDGR